MIPQRETDSELQDGVVDVEEEDIDDEGEVSDGECWPDDDQTFPVQAPEFIASPFSLQKRKDLNQQVQIAFVAQHFATALTLCTEAIMLGSPTALLCAKRAEVLLKLKRPRACIEDCNAALALDPHIGKAFRLRGIAWRHLGNWSEAHRDLFMGQQLDFDENIDAVKQFVDKRYERICARETRQCLLAVQREERAARHAMQ